ncbi:DUF4912 domain-containing protein [Paenibacillus sp. N3.4]|uniref:DUF4912 domain-containing protein n=1 Tax=Paenibacillus sp. N3.4 TaxID=2603222 RepID=UPI0021C4674F|nr:DUF4912 domain-containing protein [Paenibacillus sp. N3.4]
MALPVAGFEVPDRYNKDLLHLMVLDAHSLYVYWEISNRRRWLLSQHFACDYGALPKVIRIYDVTDIYFNGSNAHGYWDVTTQQDAAQAFLYQLGADRNFLVDIGTYTAEHQFIPLLRSNSVATPKAGEAEWGEAIQSVITEAQTESVFNRIKPHYFENIQTYSPYAR